MTHTKEIKRLKEINNVLLEACKMALDVELNYTDEGDEHPGLIKTLREAILKAERKNE